jgi:hypothetical protein
MIRIILSKIRTALTPEPKKRVNLSRRAERLHNRNRKAATQYLTIHEILEGPK